MTRNNCTNKKELTRMDALNEERLESSKKRVAHAIGLLKLWTWHTPDNDANKQTMLQDLSHAVNLLEAAEEEMQWHCDWYDYDSAVCSDINDACSDIGITLADIMNDIDEDIEIITCGVKDGLAKLSKVLATLIRWNNEETVVISEV